MFNIGGQEFMLIMLVALLVLGPDRLPGAVRRFGQVVAELKRMSGGFQAEIREALAEPMDAMKDVKKSVDDVTKGFKDVNAEMKSTITSAAAPAAAAVPAPSATPTPAVEAAANTAKDPFASAVASSAAPPAAVLSPVAGVEPNEQSQPPAADRTPVAEPDQDSTSPPATADGAVTPMAESSVGGEITPVAEASVDSPDASMPDGAPVEVPASAEIADPPEWVADAHAAAAASIESPITYHAGNGEQPASEPSLSVERPEPEPELPEWMRRLQEAQRQP